MPHKIVTENCIGCSACSSLCPVFAISGEKGQPYEINEKRCVDCGVCGRVCPKGAIEDDSGNMPERKKRDQWPKPVVDEDLCSACGLCVHWCTPEAMGISDPAYQGDIDVHATLVKSEKCIGCGLCEKHCPLDAVRMVTDVHS